MTAINLKKYKMFKIFLSFFSRPKIERLKRKSDKSFNVFRKTIEDLKTINSQASIEIDAKEVIINNLKSDQDFLNSMKSDNEKVINNINKIFE